MTIVWFSRHEPTSRQLAALKLQFGPDTIIKHDRQAFDSASDIIARYRASRADELLVVAPLSVVQQLVNRGINPIWADMRPCRQSHPEREVTIHPRSGKPRHYRFLKFWRITNIKLDLQEIGENHDTQGKAKRPHRSHHREGQSQPASLRR